MSYNFYKILHFLGIFFLFSSLGGLLIHRMNGGSKDLPSRKKIAMTHGIGLWLILLAGFGMHAKLGIAGFPMWFLLKGLIWLCLGMSTMLIHRTQSAKLLWWLLPILGAAASALALIKPV